MMRARLNPKKISIGSWVQLPDIFTAEILAKAGFDWLAIDLEHGLLDINKAFELIQVIENAGSLPLVRVNSNDASVIRRVMDAGANGVIVPMINSKDEAQSAVNAVKYPKTGQRSFGLGRAHQYGRRFQKYIEESNQRSIVIIQIEHIDAVKNLDDILKVKGIDAIMIGPYDLSGSLGIPGKFANSRYKKAIETIVTKANLHKVPLGVHIVHPSLMEFQKRVKEGFTFIGYGMDSIFLSESCREAVDSTRRYVK